MSKYKLCYFCEKNRFHKNFHKVNDTRKDVCKWCIREQIKHRKEKETTFIMHKTELFCHDCLKIKKKKFFKKSKYSWFDKKFIYDKSCIDCL